MGCCSPLVANRTQGIFADANNAIMDTRVVTNLLDAAEVRDGMANGAYYFYRINNPNNLVGQLDVQALNRQTARARGYQIVEIYTPFSTVAGDIGDAANFLAGLQHVLDLTEAEPDIIWLLGNQNSDSWTGTDDEWHQLEGAGIALIEASGRRWAAHTDEGITSDCAKIVSRVAWWDAAGVVVENCLFLGTHNYNVGGFVPALYLLAQDSLARVSIPYPLVSVELAWDFIKTSQGENRGNRPDIFLPPATTWQRLNYAFCRHHGIAHGSFDAPMHYNSNGTLTSWGDIWADEQKRQPSWVEPTPAEALAIGGYNVANAIAKAQNLVYNNQPGLTVPEREALATAAGNRIAAGYLFSR